MKPSGSKGARTLFNDEEELDFYDVALPVLRLIHNIAPESYIVGGFVRDHLLGRPCSADVDIVMADDAIVVAGKAAESIGPDATFIPLDLEFRTARLVIPTKPYVSIDLSSFKGNTLENDLSCRDFTINSLAVPLGPALENRECTIIDQTGGMEDLHAKLIRPCSRNSFIRDPLRLLRAFRFKTLFGFDFADEVPESISGALPSLRDVSWERIRDELVAILAHGRSAAILRDMDSYGIMDVIFPELSSAKKVSQNIYHHLDVWEHSVETVHQLELILEDMYRQFEDLAAGVETYCCTEPVRGRPRKVLLKLASLLHDSGKPSVKSVDSSGRTRFFCHEKESEAISESAMERLKMSRKETAFVLKLVRGHMRPSIFTSAEVSSKAQRKIFREFGVDLTGLILVFLADLAASRGPARPSGDMKVALRNVRRTLKSFEAFKREPPVSLLNGREVMEALGIRQGPIVGTILKKLMELQDSGELIDKNQALSAAGKILISAERQEKDAKSMGQKQ
jgi:poly(A) polymerase